MENDEPRGCTGAQGRPSPQDALCPALWSVRLTAVQNKAELQKGPQAKCPLI